MDRAVEVTHTADGITLLFDTFSGESRNLLESFKNAGAAFHAAVIEDDGFLPDDVMSVYGFFLGDYRKAVCDFGCTGAIRIPGGRKNPYRQPAEKEEADSRTAGLRNDGCGS